MTLEGTNLAALVVALRAQLEGRLPDSYVRGRTAIRDTIVAQRGTSEAEAEELVQMLESRRLVTFHPAPEMSLDDRGTWRFRGV